MIKKVMKDHDSSKGFGPDCIPVEILNYCQFELN